MPAKTSRPAEQTAPDPSASGGTGLRLVAGAAALQAWMELGAETVRFVWDRLQQDMKTQQAMLACTSLDELRTIQAQFFIAAQQQYAAEAGKMLGLLSKATAEGLSSPALKRRYDDVPL